MNDLIRIELFPAPPTEPGDYLMQHPLLDRPVVCRVFAPHKELCAELHLNTGGWQLIPLSNEGLKAAKFSRRLEVCDGE
jgi:hypothetical protein